MTRGDRVAATIGIFVLAGGLAAGCGGGADVMRATLTAKGCTYEGSTTPDAGVFKVQVRNETHDVANFSLWELAEGAKIEEIEPWYAKAPRNVDPPQLKRPISSSLVAAGTTGELPVNERAGRYVVLCGLDASPSTGLGFRLYAATELDVQPTS